MKLKNTLLALGLVGSFGATAAPIYLDLSQYGPSGTGDLTGSDLVTNTLLGFNGPLNFAPVSAYFDDNGTPGLNVGDSVVDTASAVVILQDNPFASPDPGTDSSWRIKFEYTLYGQLLSIDSFGNYNAGFGAGSASMSLFSVDVGTGTESYVDDIADFDFDFMELDDFDPAQHEAALDLYFEATGMAPGLFFNEQGKDLSLAIGDGDDLTKTSLLVQVDLEDLDTVPQQASGASPSDPYTRSVVAGSPDLTLTAVSEPGSLAIFGLGLLGLAGAARRKSKKA